MDFFSLSHSHSCSFPLCASHFVRFSSVKEHKRTFDHIWFLFPVRNPNLLNISIFLLGGRKLDKALGWELALIYTCNKVQGPNCIVQGEDWKMKGCHRNIDCMHQQKKFSLSPCKGLRVDWFSESGVSVLPLKSISQFLVPRLIK